MAEKLDEYEEALKKLPRVEISGSGRVSEEEVAVSGTGRIAADVEVRSVKASGSLKAEGRVKAEQIRVSGSASFLDYVEAGEARILGSASFKAGLTCKSLEVYGSCRVSDGLTAETRVKASGSLKVGGDLKSFGSVELRGVFDVDGRVEAKYFYAKLEGRSRVGGGVEAEIVEVYGVPRETGFTLLGIDILGFRRRRGELHTPRVKAEGRVYVENVVCDTVEGSRVEVGRGCEVRGRVRYRDSIRVHPEAKLAYPPERVQGDR